MQTHILLFIQVNISFYSSGNITIFIGIYIKTNATSFIFLCCGFSSCGLRTIGPRVLRPRHPPRAPPRRRRVLIRRIAFIGWFRRREPCDNGARPGWIYDGSSPCVQDGLSISRPCWEVAVCFWALSGRPRQRRRSGGMRHRTGRWSSPETTPAIPSIESSGGTTPAISRVMTAGGLATRSRSFELG